MAGNVKFVRIRGHVVPISTTEAGKRKDRAEILRNTAKTDAEVSKRADKVAKGSYAAAALTATASVLARKKFSPKLGAALSLGLAGFGLLNQSFSAGRKMSAKDREEYAEQLASGKKLKKGSGIGGASEGAYRDAKFVKKLSARDLAYYKGATKK